MQFEQFWVEVGPLGQPGEASSDFVSTPSVRSHLRNLARAVQLRKHPVLLQVSIRVTGWILGSVLVMGPQHF